MHRGRRPGYEDYKYFPSRRPQPLHALWRIASNRRLGAGEAPRRHYLGHRLLRLWHGSGDRLTVLTRVDTTDDRPRGLQWHEVDGRTERGRSGGALNRAEADAVTAWVAECGMPPTSLGVVTPFRAQARLIRQRLSERAGPAFEDVRVGTAHTFQGAECETILFSTVLSVDANPGTVAWLEGERNLINVAVSRARRHLVVFGSRKELRRLGASTLLALPRLPSATA